VLTATNSWLHSQTQHSQHRYDRERGYVCTFSGLVIKSTTAHLFHVGDARIYRLRGSELDATDRGSPRPGLVGAELPGPRAGHGPQGRHRLPALQLAVGDLLLLPPTVSMNIPTLPCVRSTIAAAPTSTRRPGRSPRIPARGSGDNLTVQLVRIDELPDPEANEIYRQLSDLPCPPLLEARSEFDGYQIVRVIKRSARSHIYLAVDSDSGERS
jgi:hypothetical protein